MARNGKAPAIARPGRYSPGLDAVLAAAGLREAAFVGAWNPFSRLRPRRCNDMALDRLRRLAARAGLAWLEGAGVAHRPFWREEHLLLLGPLPKALVLARRFRQHAVLRVRLRARAMLLVLQ